MAVVSAAAEFKIVVGTEGVFERELAAEIPFLAVGNGDVAAQCGCEQQFLGDVPVGVCIGFEQGAVRCGIYRNGRSFWGECVEVCGEAAVETVAD